MEKDVLISINGTQYGSGTEPEPIEVITPGQYYYKNGSHYLMFDDVGDDLNEATSNIMKFRPAYLEVEKNGFADAKLMFEENKKTMSIYKTPFGTMEISVSATSIRLKQERESIELTVDYSIDINHSYMADCCLLLKATSRKKGIVLTS